MWSLYFYIIVFTIAQHALHNVILTLDLYPKYFLFQFTFTIFICNNNNTNRQPVQTHKQAFPATRS